MATLTVYLHRVSDEDKYWRKALAPGETLQMLNKETFPLEWKTTKFGPLKLSANAPHRSILGSILLHQTLSPLSPPLHPKINVKPTDRKYCAGKCLRSSLICLTLASANGLQIHHIEKLLINFFFFTKL